MAKKNTNVNENKRTERELEERLRKRSEEISKQGFTITKRDGRVIHLSRG